MLAFSGLLQYGPTNLTQKKVTKTSADIILCLPLVPDRRGVRRKYYLYRELFVMRLWKCRLHAEYKLDLLRLLSKDKSEKAVRTRVCVCERKLLLIYSDGGVLLIYKKIKIE